MVGRTQRARRDLVPARVGVSVTPGETLRTVRELGRERALVLAKALKVHPAVLLFPDFDVSGVA